MILDYTRVKKSYISFYDPKKKVQQLYYTWETLFLFIISWWLEEEEEVMH